MEKNLCATCLFFDRAIIFGETIPADFGICHAHPPVQGLGFPTVNVASWCGEHKEQPIPIPVKKK